MEEAPLYVTWLDRDDSYYQESYAVTIVENLCQYGGGTTAGREGKGKILGAGYEVFIYAFFLGLYSGVRRPMLRTAKKKFRMKMRDWGNINEKYQNGRKKYKNIQRYIFMSLVAKSNIDFIALDKGELSLDDAATELMTTLNEYANQGFYLMNEKLKSDPKYFVDTTNFIVLLKEQTNSNPETMYQMCHN